jgi:hypothetical protein
MIGVSLAIGDFMLMLLGAIFWAVTGVAGWALLAIGAGVFLLFAIRRQRGRARARRGDLP